MRFKIRRISDHYISFDETPPCKNAVIVEEQEPIFDWIRDKNNQWIRCDIAKIKIVKHWEVDINTLEELLELQTEVNNPLVILSDDSLEIKNYNDYRE